MEAAKASAAAFKMSKAAGSEAVAGTINMLCSDRLSDIGEGACYQSTFLDVEAWEQQRGAEASPR